MVMLKPARALTSLLAFTTMLGAGATRAQISAITNMSDRVFSAADCDSEVLLEATFSYFSTSFYSHQYAIFGVNALSAQELTLCYNQPTGTNVLIEGQSLPIDGVVELPEDHALTVAEFLAPICSGTGYTGVRLLCFRVAEYNTAQGSGVDFIVDTQVPAAPTEYRWQGSDRSVVLASVSPPAGTTAGEVLTYMIEMRSCSGGSMPTLDAGRSDVVSSPDSSLEEGGFEDALLEDAQADDGSSADQGAGDAAVADSAMPDTALEDGGAAVDSLCGASGAFAEVKTGVQLPLTVGGLVNGNSYEVRVKVKDESGNTGAPSEAEVVVPAPEFGFWDVYAGEEEGCGGCSSAGGSRPSLALLLLGAALLGLRGRRGRGRRGALLGLVALMAALVSGGARADDPEVGLRLSAGPYKPDMDSEAGANDVYRCVFDDKTWVILGTGLDYIVFDMIGTLTVGGEMSYFTVNGHERTSLPSNGECGTSSSSRNTLHMLPLAGNLHYRFDWPYHQFGFPLAPYGRVGLIATPWTITRNAQFQSSEPNAGLRTGWQWALGLAFVLDAIDEVRMKRVRDAGTFQHAYLFGEYRDMRIDSFGEPGFRLGAQTWLVGVNLDI